mgnify:CR=1 FL=1
MDIIGGGTPKTSKPEYWNGDIPWLSGGDIANAHQGRQQHRRRHAALAEVAIEHVRINRQINRLPLAQRPRLLRDCCGRHEKCRKNGKQRPPVPES